MFAPTAGYNVAVGRLALGNAAAGGDNVAVGDMALTYCSGKKNIALGASAGDKITTGDHNIDIGNEGTATDNRIIRIGNRKTQRATYFAAINGVTVADGVPVIINALGQLGTATSSARYKEGIKPMNEASKPVLSLQPVTFRYKKELDPQAIPQFGLVAEDVAKVDPELVARDEEGKPYTVRYEAVNAMLLNEFIKEHQKVTDQNREIAQLRAAVTRLKATVEKVGAQLAPDQF